MRQIVLDTETTGLETSQGHRIIEIGGVEVVNRRLTGNRFHQYIRPEREIDPGAQEVHGITNEFLQDKPIFSEIVGPFLEFIDGGQLVIHNAPFDVGFIDHELGMLGDVGQLSDYCSVLDTLVMARQMHPGQKNNLDALCKRYEVDNSSRELHGALLDAEILAMVYLAMTGGQVDLSLGADVDSRSGVIQDSGNHWRLDDTELKLSLATLSADDLQAHEQYLKKLREEAGDLVWDRV